MALILDQSGARMAGHDRAVGQPWSETSAPVGLCGSATFVRFRKMDPGRCRTVTRPRISVCSAPQCLMNPDHVTVVIHNCGWRLGPRRAVAHIEKVSGKWTYRLIKGGVGHSLPGEAPPAFADAIGDVMKYDGQIASR